MIEIIFKAMGYIGIIILAYILKRTGVIKKEDSGVLTKMLLWITLPCSVISAFSLGENIEGLFFLPIIGFALNIFMIAIAYLISIRKDKRGQGAIRNQYFRIQHWGIRNALCSRDFGAFGIDSSMYV